MKRACLLRLLAKLGFTGDHNTRTFVQLYVRWWDVKVSTVSVASYIAAKNQVKSETFSNCFCQGLMVKMHSGVRLILYKGLYFRPKKYFQLNIEVAHVWLDGKSLALSLGFAQFCRIVHHMILLLVLAFNKGSSTIDQSMLYTRSNFSTRLLPILGCHRPTA